MNANVKNEKLVKNVKVKECEQCNLVTTCQLVNLCITFFFLNGNMARKVKNGHFQNDDKVNKVSRLVRVEKSHIVNNDR